MASDYFVVNASPLILLSSVNGLEWLLDYLSSPVQVPQTVLNEVEAGGGGVEIVTRIQSDAGFSIVPTVPVPSTVAAWDLGAGESQVLAHCYRDPTTIAVLDDKAARNCARALGIRVIGTLGLILISKRRGRISHAKPVIERLRAQGMFLSDDLVRDLLKEVGE